jgi:hypothetical protein
MHFSETTNAFETLAIGFSEATVMPTNLYASLLPSLLLLLGIIPVTAIAAFHRQRYVRRRSPLKDMLRPPGHSLRLEVERLRDEIQENGVIAMIIPMMAYIGVSASGTPQPNSGTTWWMFVVVAVVAEAWVYRRIGKLLAELRPKSLGLDGEMFVGEALNQLMLEGCRVFHDVPIEYGNVDHVVVSRSGVFAINTKTLGKPRTVGGDEKVTVNYSENVMQFPDRTVPIPQKKILAEAKSLAAVFLTNATGEEIGVEPMLALPGWFIRKEKIGEGPVCVFNPKNSVQFFIKDKVKLSESMIQRISHQLDQKCRDVEPQLSGKVRWKSTK